MIIQPQKQFLIDYRINNPVDTGTYYVRAVVKDSVSGDTLATLNLTDNGNKYFSYLWVTPADPSNFGRQIVIHKTVYSDDTYETVSPNYGTTTENYIVRALPSQFNMGAGYGSGVSKRDLEEIVQKHVSSIVIPEPKTDLTEVLNAIGGVKEGLWERFKQKLPKIVKIGEQADSISAINDATLKTVDTLKELLNSVDKKLRTAVEEIRDEKESAKDELRDYFYEAIQSALEDFKSSTNSSIEEAAGRLEDVLVNKAEEMSKQVQKSMEKTLNEPMELKIFQNVVGQRANAKGGETETESPSMARAKKLMERL